MERYLIIADDITGSNDTGVQLKRRGINTVVTLDPHAVGAMPMDLFRNCQTPSLRSVFRNAASLPPCEPQGFAASSSPSLAKNCRANPAFAGFERGPISYVLDTESRSLDCDAAFAVLSRAVSNADIHSFDYVVKKVDSTLRGPIAHEVLAVDTAYAPELVVFMPALPDLGRLTMAGVHVLHGKPITETEFADDPIAPVREDNLKNLLQAVYDEPVTHVGLEDIESGGIRLDAGRVFTFDTISNAHMRKVVAAVLATGKKTLWVGSAGLVDNLVEIRCPHRPAVALVSSLSEITRDQVQFARMRGTAAVVIPTEDIAAYITSGGAADGGIRDAARKAAQILGNASDVIILSALSANRAEMSLIEAAAAERGISLAQASRLALQYLARVMSQVLAARPVSGLFVTGGDTAMSLLDELGAKGLRIVSEVLIGIPLARIVGGPYDNTKIITKAGAFGQSDALFFCMRKLREVSEQEVSEQEAH